MDNVERRADESENAFILRVWQEHDTETWQEVAELLNATLNKNLTPTAYRVRACRERRKTEDPRAEKFTKQWFNDERAAWNRQNREQARTEANLNLLQEALLDISIDTFPDVEHPQDGQKKTMLILLTDWHIGSQYHSIFGDYDSDIARERVRNLLAYIIRLQEKEQCEQAYVMSLGDMINGAIRRTTQLQNRENVIEQIKKATQLMTNFTLMLCRLFKKVYLTGAAGNHSRLVENKENAVKDDRLDTIITWASSLLLSQQANFQYIEPIDTTLAEIEIYGKLVWGVHGDYDRFNKKGMTDLTMAMGRFPYAICMGHLHSSAYSEISGVQMIRGGSLAGSGDDYTIQRRLSGKAQQTVCIFNEQGIESIHPVVVE